MNKVYLVVREGASKCPRRFNIYKTKRDAKNKDKNKDESIDSVLIDKDCAGFMPSLTKITEVSFKTLK